MTESEYADGGVDATLFISGNLTNYNATIRSLTGDTATRGRFVQRAVTPTQGPAWAVSRIFDSRA